MTTQLSSLSASVTRILSLTGFPKELKTKDIQTAFAEWEGQNGGFKIKWRDDTSLLIVFQDASVAKRAYLQTLAFPPAVLNPPNGTVVIKPYDGPDAQAVIQNVNSRGQHNQNASRQSNRSNSISVFPTRQSSNSFSSSNGAPNNFRHNVSNSSQHVTIPEYQHSNGREPSPTLPNLPTHPTLNSLISSSLGEAVRNSSPPSDPAILATSLHPDMNGAAGGPRIGDPGKRMLGAALGMRHPSLGPRTVNGSSGNGTGMDQGMGLQRAMGGLVISE